MKPVISSIFIFFILVSNSFSNEIIFNQKSITRFLMNPENGSPMIYPLELGHEMKVIKKNNDWLNVTDEKTGLNGWVISDDFGLTKPEGSVTIKDYKKSFNIFSEKLEEMSSSIEEAIGIKTFITTKHIGGVAAIVVANQTWFSGRRHKNQAFQVYEIWKGLNQSPSFLSFQDEMGEEKFIVLSGPNRPRYLKAKEN